MHKNKYIMKPTNRKNRQWLYLFNTIIRIPFQSLVDAGRKLNLHKTFRRRSGRLRNVLFTFSVSPVSMGSIPFVRNNRSGQNL